MAPAVQRAVKVPTSREEADALLLELGKLDALEARNQADCDKAVAAVVERHAALNKVEIDGVDVAIADRRAQLREALAEFAHAHRDELLGKKGKTVTLNHGTFSWRKIKEALEPVDGQSAAGRASLLDRLHEFLVEKLTKFEELSAAAVGCLNVQIKWRQSDLLHARQDKRIEADELRKIGFKVTGGEEEEVFTAKAAPVELASQSAEKPE